QRLPVNVADRTREVAQFAISVEQAWLLLARGPVAKQLHRGISYRASEVNLRLPRRLTICPTVRRHCRTPISLLAGKFLLRPTSSPKSNFYQVLPRSFRRGYDAIAGDLAGELRPRL